jgi:hypothetical protein
MKLHILYNDAGDVAAICHAENPGGKFLPGKGQHTAVLKIPSELESLKPHELHRTVRVDTKGKSHRLVAKTKDPMPPASSRGSITRRKK